MAQAVDATRMLGILGNWAEGRGPLYARLTSALARAVDRGDLTPGTRLPPERWLAAALSVSRSTVVASYDRLADQQWLERRQGSGTYIRADGRRRDGTRQDELAASLDRNTMFRGLITGTGDTIDFSLAAPTAAPAVVEALHSLPKYAPDAAAIGQGYVPAGLPALRAAVARYLTDAGLATSDSQVLVTTGGQQALALLASLWITPGDPVAVENPTYPGALDAFRSARARLLAVAVDEQGVRVDALRDLLGRMSPRLVYISSSFNNPTGAMLPHGRRRDLARLAQEFQIPIVEDLVLSEIALTDAPVPPPAAAMAGDWAIAVGSMSKLFWGGLRVGWIRAPEQVIFRLAQLKAVADLGTSMVAQWLCIELLNRVEEVRSWRLLDTRKRLGTLTESLADLLPSWTWRMPDGGNDLWVRLPHGSASDFLQLAVRYGVMAAAGPLFSVDGGHADHVRLPFVLEPDQLREGVRRLADAWQAYLPRSSQVSRELRAVV
ncbi:MAG TPA: PLP-dependent aminotransferase family protein [Chloroflexota bacterium]|nr:PLP-dependent aminotransferase family protein [Chloroflexota bacterium]